MSTAAHRPSSKSLYSWEFVFTDSTTGLPVSAGVFATEFGKARAKALEKIVAKVGGDSARFAFSSYQRLN